MEHKIRSLTILAGAALAAAIGLWGAFLLPGVPLASAWPGLADTVVLVALLAGIIAAYRRELTERTQQHQQELKALRSRQSEELLQATAENRAAMDRFRSSLTHSLRMPAAIIQGYADLLISGVVTEDSVRDEYLRKISDRSQYLTEAISRQVSSGETLSTSKLNYSDLDLLTLVRQAASDMQTAASNQGVTIQVVSPESSVPLRGDAYLLNRVFFNLLENALKYMGRPGVITIRVLQEGEKVSIRVQDDGLGLSAEETAHIFEPNFQGSNHTHGQGYGLYLVKQAVESHGGTISAQSMPGRGMGITMVLPTAPPTAE